MRDVKDMRDKFKDMDEDGSGTITLEELEVYFEDAAMKSYFQVQLLLRRLARSLSM